MPSSHFEAFRAHSSSTRKSILRLLFRGPLGVDGIAGELGLQPVSVRHHLKALEEVSIIEGFKEEHRGVGRPRCSTGSRRNPRW